MSKSAFPWAMLLRHQLASAVATAVDFLTMVALVEDARFDPAVATLVGATAGAVVNFLWNRNLTFDDSRDGPLLPQAARYALVSAVSALLNGAGELAGTRLFGFSYLPLRLAVSAFISVAWNFPMQRSFVFRSGESGSIRPTATGLS